MKITPIVRVIMVLASVFCLCISADAQDTSTPSASPSKAQTILDRNPVPAGLAVFGARGEKTIRVVVYGQVNRPGIYDLSQGALVRDAVQDAQGLQKLFWWGHSYVLRNTVTDQPEFISFLNKKQTWQEVPLQEGDRLYLGYEVY